MYDDIIVQLTNHFTTILSIDTIKRCLPELWWGSNGLGDRWANKRFNYTVIYSSRKTKTYSEYGKMNERRVSEALIDEFFRTVRVGFGIVGIFVHSVRLNIEKRPISHSIKRVIITKSCVICGSSSSIVCDHKNDLYNEPHVLTIAGQTLDDFQPLCQHCNLVKRQVCIDEKRTGKLFDPRTIVSRYAQYPLGQKLPFLQKTFDLSDHTLKHDTFWYDPVEFDRKMFIYMTYVVPLNNELKKKFSVFTPDKRGKKRKREQL